jgi:hypothetical protein
MGVFFFGLGSPRLGSSFGSSTGGGFRFRGGDFTAGFLRPARARRTISSFHRRRTESPIIIAPA